MNKREKAAREILKSYGHHVTKSGDGRHVDAVIDDAQTLKHGLIARVLGKPPKKGK